MQTNWTEIFLRGFGSEIFSATIKKYFMALQQQGKRPNTEQTGNQTKNDFQILS